MPATSSQEISFIGQATALRQRWRWVAVPLVIFPLLAVYVGSLQGQAYQASARVLLVETAAQEAVTGQTVGNNEIRRRFLENEISRARSDQVAQAVRERLELDDTARLPAADIRASRDSDVLIFTLWGSSAADAAKAANAWADAYVDNRDADSQDSIDQILTELNQRVEELQDRRGELRAEVEALEERLTRTLSVDARARILAEIDAENATIAGELTIIDTRIESTIDDITDLRLTMGVGTGSAEVVRAAVASGSTSAVALVARNLVVGLVLGAIVGTALALLAENLNRRIRSGDDVERLGYTVLGSIPKAGRRMSGRQNLYRVAHTAPGTPLADAFQKLRSALQFRIETEGVRTVLVTSPGGGAGKTFVVANLALAFATVDSRAVLVDADLRRPDLHNHFGSPQTPGLSDVLIETAQLADVVSGDPQLPTRLVVIPAGTQPPSPSIVLASTAMGELVGRLSVDADLTFFDSAPVLSSADAQSVAARMDGVLLVVAVNETSPDELQAAADSIVSAGGRLLGVVVNGGLGSGSGSRSGAGSSRRRSGSTDAPALARPAVEVGAGSGSA